MTVFELIERLKQLPPNVRVVTRGYEGGYCDITEIQEKKLRLNVHREWFYGPHDEPYGDNEPFDEKAYCL